MIAASGAGTGLLLRAGDAGPSAGVSIPVAETSMEAPTVIDVAFDQSEVSIQAGQGGRLDAQGAGLVVPQGALASDATLQMRVLRGPFHVNLGAPPDDGKPHAIAVGPVVDFGPTGITFLEPVTITVPYDEASLPAGASEDSVVPVYWNGRSWVVLAGVVDKNANTVSVRLRDFKGVALATAVAVTGLALINIAIWMPTIQKLTASDAIKRGEASKWITPGDPVVRKAAGAAQITDPFAGVSTTLGSASLPAMLAKADKDGHPMTLDYNGMPKAGRDEGEGAGWQKPADYFTRGDKQGRLHGDCTDMTNSSASVFIAAGYPAKAVFGYGVDNQGNLDTNRAHAWTEVLIGGTIWLVDDEGGIHSPENWKATLPTYQTPAPGDSRYRAMWDDQDQEPYNKEWWRATVSIEPAAITDPTQPITLTATVKAVPKHVKSFTTVFDWGDGTMEAVSMTTPDSDRNAVVISPRHSMGSQLSKPVTVTFRDQDGKDLLEWGVLTVPVTAIDISAEPPRIEDPTAMLTLGVTVRQIPPSVPTFTMVVDWGDGSPLQRVPGRKRDLEGNAHIVVSNPRQLANQGRGVSQVTVSFVDAEGRPLKGWRALAIPVTQPTAAPGFTAIRLALWMGRCSFCVDFRAGTELRLVAASRDAYAGNPADLAAWGIASLDLAVGDQGRIITSLRIVYGDDPNHVLTLTGIPLIATQPDPRDKKTLSQYSMRGFQEILKHLTWQLPSGKDQSSWIQDPESGGQEYLDIYLKQP